MNDNINSVVLDNSEFNMSVGNYSEPDDKSTPPNFVTQRKPMVDSPSQGVTLASDQLHDFKEEMRKMLTYYATTQNAEINNLNATLKEIQQSTRNIEATVEYLKSQNEESKQKISSLETQVKEDREYILFLENKLEEQQITTRKQNFELKNVPKIENETKQDLVNMVVHLSETVDCKVNKSDIKDIYRVRPKNPAQKNTPVIVETTSVLLRNDLLRMAKSFNIKNKTKLSAKHLGFKTSEDTPVFLSEHLTPNGARLYFLARDLKQSKGYKFCWVSYGRVFVRKDEQSPVILINSENQVHNLLLKK